MGAIQKANEEVFLELAELGKQVLDVANKYGLPALKLVMALKGVPGPFRDFMDATLKYAFDDLRKLNTEDAELRALTATSCVAHAQIVGDKYQQVTTARLRNLYQRVTKKATEIRQEDRVRVVIAATLGGSDAEIASPEDLAAAEWLERAPESKLMFLQAMCEDLFGPEVLQQIILRPPGPNDQERMIMTAPTPCRRVPTDIWIRDWTSKSLSIWNEREVFKEMFEGPPAQTFQKEEGLVAFCDFKKGAYKEWPKPILQRIHNAFARTKQIMAYDLVRTAENATRTATPDKPQ